MTLLSPPYRHGQLAGLPIEQSLRDSLLYPPVTRYKFL